MNFDEHLEHLKTLRLAVKSAWRKHTESTDNRMETSQAYESAWENLDNATREFIAAYTLRKI